MLALVVQVIVFLWGLVILIRGRFDLFDKRRLAGKPARIVGLILMLSGALPLLVWFAFGVVLGASAGDPGLILRTASESWIAVVDWLLVLGGLVIATLVVWKAPVAQSASLPAVVTISEAAKYMDRPETDVVQLIEEGDLTGRLIGEEYRIERDALIGFTEDRDQISLAEMLRSIRIDLPDVAIGMASGAISGAWGAAQLAMAVTRALVEINLAAGITDSDFVQDGVLLPMSLLDFAPALLVGGVIGLIAGAIVAKIKWWALVPIIIAVIWGIVAFNMEMLAGAFSGFVALVALGLLGRLKRSEAL